MLPTVTLAKYKTSGKDEGKMSVASTCQKIFVLGDHIVASQAHLLVRVLDGTLRTAAEWQPLRCCTSQALPTWPPRRLAELLQQSWLPIQWVGWANLALLLPRRQPIMLAAAHLAPLLPGPQPIMSEQLQRRHTHGNGPSGPAARPDLCVKC